MLKVLVVGIGVLAASQRSASAVDDSQTVERWHEAHYVCKMGEERDGGVVSEEAHDTICRERERLGRVLLKDDYCWSQSEQEWYPVGQDEGFCQQLN